MGEQYTYRNLILWQRAQEMAHAVLQVVKRLPNSPASSVMARQIIGAATSVGANIAEGHGRFSIGAHRNHLSIARGSAAETDSWLDLLRREGLLSVEEEIELHNRCKQLMGMLTNKINALEGGESGQSRSGKGVHETLEPYLVHAGQTPLFPFVEDDYLLPN